MTATRPSFDASAREDLIVFVPATSLLFLAFLGSLPAGAGGARVAVGAMRVTFRGALAMGLTAGVGALFGVRQKTKRSCWYDEIETFRNKSSRKSETSLGLQVVA